MIVVSRHDRRRSGTDRVTRSPQSSPLKTVPCAAAGPAAELHWRGSIGSGGLLAGGPDFGPTKSPREELGNVRPPDRSSASHGICSRMPSSDDVESLVEPVQVRLDHLVDFRRDDRFAPIEHIGDVMTALAADDRLLGSDPP